ncbi:MAG: glycosyltransferase [Alphaproteobacteria bacterium]|nr:glycosyltransferase [Alphaproteobacteria bacterium]
MDLSEFPPAEPSIGGAGVAPSALPPLRIVFLGLSITSSWGNGHATTYRSLVRGLVRRGHSVLFLEHDKPWYRANRDLERPPYGETRLYGSVAELADLWRGAIRNADLVVLGSYVPEGVAVARLVQRTAHGATAFYDIDTPVTLAALAAGRCEYLAPELIRGFDLYLSFTGGPTLRELETRWGARAALPLYCSADQEDCRRVAETAPVWDLGYLGTYSDDRQPMLDRLLCAPARGWPEGRFVVAGSLYPEDLVWPANCERIDHLPPDRHPPFYAAQRFTLNVTRAEMVRRGFSPSVRLFEAALCGTPVISDCWPGIETLFRPGVEILLARSEADVLGYLCDLPEPRRRAVAAAARARVLASHTGAHRAAELERYARRVLNARAATGEAAACGW